MTKLINQIEKCKRDHLQDVENTIGALEHVIAYDDLTIDTTAMLSRRVLMLKLSRNRLMADLEGMANAISLVQSELNCKVRKEVANVGI